MPTSMHHQATMAPAPTSDATAPPGPARRAVAGLCLAMLLPSLDTSIANIALPTLRESFAAPFRSVQWVVLAYLLTVTTSIVTAGRVGDMLGRRRVLMTGIALFTVASVACGLAPSLGLLIAARAAQGVAAALVMALTLAVMREAAPAARTGRAIGLLGTMSAVGTALGPSLGGALIEWAGWRAIFLINVPLGVVTLVLLGGALPPDGVTSVSSAAGAPTAPTRSPERFDLVGTLLLAMTLAAYALAMTTGHDGFGVRQWGLLAGAAAGALLFVLAESRAGAPLIAPALLREPALVAAILMTALVTTVVMTSLVIGPFHLSIALGLDAAQVGLAMSCGPIAAALAGVPAGRLVDRVGGRRTMLAGLIASAIGCLSLAAMPRSLGVPGYVVPLVVVTIGYALFQAANTTAVMTDARPDRRGVVAGVITLARNLGLITGTAVMGALFARSSGSADGRAPHADATAHGTHLTFAVATVLMLVAIAIAARAQRRSAPRGP